jgi:hypothetical protein
LTPCRDPAFVGFVNNGADPSAELWSTFWPEPCKGEPFVEWALVIPRLATMLSSTFMRKAFKSGMGGLVLIEEMT